MDTDLLPLFAWLSPSFPTGAYAYSHGLETAVEDGRVRDAEALAGWVGDLLRFGSGRNDAILFRLAHAAVTAGDAAGFAEINDHALALAPSRERLLETQQQGRAFADVVRAAWPADIGVTAEGPLAYPVAVAGAAAAHGLAVRPALDAMLLAFAGNLCSAAVRLVPLGQTDGQRALARLAPVAAAVAAETDGAGFDDLGGCAVMADLAAMTHETLDGRLFRS